MFWQQSWLPQQWLHGHWLHYYASGVHRSSCEQLTTTNHADEGILATWITEEKAIRKAQEKLEEDMIQKLHEEETILKLEEIREGKEWKANTRLSKAFKMARDELSTELSTCIERAIYFLDYLGTDSSPRGALDALKRTTEALDMCKRGGALWIELDKAKRKLYDSLTLRTQLNALPIGDKKKYQAVLQKTYGRRINDEENSRLMQSYRKVIWPEFEDAFPSNNKAENIRRGHTRPRRERGLRRSDVLEDARDVLEVGPPPGLVLPAPAAYTFNPFTTSSVKFQELETIMHGQNDA